MIYCRLEQPLRIDETIIFRPLNRADLREIAKLQLDRVQSRMEDRSGARAIAALTTCRSRRLLLNLAACL